jgi:hypothetical protein
VNRCNVNTQCSEKRVQSQSALPFDRRIGIFSGLQTGKRKYV